MLVSWVVVVIAVVGLLMYVLSANPKVSDVGRIMFACGLLVTCLVLGGKAVRILP
jgi:Na+/phosphate symporter